jgi:two-component system chemotaxis sensor kinase CheA
MGLSEKIRQQLINSFKTEQKEHVQKITQGLLALEKNPPAEERKVLLDEVFRGAHSLKGGARAVGMTIIEGLSHNMEDLLLSIKSGRLDFSSELFDLLYQALDAVELVIEQVEAGNPSPPAKVIALLARLEEAKGITKRADQEEIEEIGVESKGDDEVTKPETKIETKIIEDSPLVSPPKAEAQPSTSTAQSLISKSQDETIRVSISKLDALMNQFSELVGAKIRAEQRLAEVRQMQAFAVEWYKLWQNLRRHYNRLLRLRDMENEYNKDVAALIDFAAQNQEALRTFNAQSNLLYRQSANDTMRLSLIIDELQEEIKRVRMLPLSTITVTFARMIRDLARDQGKQINLTITGDETELDKRVLEQIKDPLIHLLRNAVDHGIEDSQRRRRAGKPVEGHIILSASQQGDNIVITISDDGGGLNLESIRQAAVRKRLLTLTEAQKLNQTEVADLIFRSGISTSQIITDISGRGVGLDVVRQNVEELHGTLQIDFVPDQKTTFTMVLPLTLASSRGLLVKVGEQVFALPLSTVERMLRVDRDSIGRIEGKEAIIYEDRPVGLVWLEDLLELPLSPRDVDRLTIVIISVAEKRLGLIVDELVGEQEIVIKNLGKQLLKVSGIAGATVLGTGQVILVLHTADLIRLAAQTGPRRAVVPAADLSKTTRQRTILVVDDSITTRTLEKNILEAAGYRVKLATNGQEALAAVGSDSAPDLIVSDINMPRLDGFELTSRLKRDKRYTDIPIILVTSLDSPADKARGIEVGADAYIVKSSFDQGNLLETIEQLV